MKVRAVLARFEPGTFLEGEPTHTKTVECEDDELPAHLEAFEQSVPRGPLELVSVERVDQ